jgi:putative MFS transporter
MDQVVGQAAAIAARLDRVPATRRVWRMVVLLSLGGMFEYSDLFLTGYVVPGLVRAGLLGGVAVGVFAGPALFVAATFAGLWVGTLVFGFVADRFGRRSVFTWSLLWYCAASVVMALQFTGAGVVLWRLIAGIGIGVELVTIDTYLAELVPKDLRGRAFAVNSVVQFSAVPLVALLAWWLVPIQVAGLDGWRWVVMAGALAAVLVWGLRLGLPESPRWLINQGRLGEAERVVAALEREAVADRGGMPLPAPSAYVAEESGAGRFAEIWRPAYRGRTIMMMVFMVFQSVGFYGFANWVPTLIAQKGINLSGSLLYSFVIACANPLGPLLLFGIADRVERKWLIVTASLGTAVFGSLFALQTEIAVLLLFGVAITLSNNVMSTAFHAYQGELFPTRVRARAIGFVYSFSRLSTVFVSFIIAFLLQTGGVPAVFAFISAAMLVVMITIGGFGPKTNRRRLEELAH